MLDSKTTSLPARPGTPLDHIHSDTLERISHFLSAPKLRVYRDLKGLCDRVSDSYRDRVVTELIQNAHDAHPIGTTIGRIHIALDPKEGPFGTLYVANDGQGFTRANFEALCSPTLTTKNVNEAIGNKGVGFLSVFQVSAHPEIYSRLPGGGPNFDGYCFSFATDDTLRLFLERKGLGNEVDQIIANMPRLYLACPTYDQPTAVSRFAEDGFATVIRLPLKAGEALAAVEAQLGKIVDEDPPMQLFLTRIAELSVKVDPGQAATVLRRTPKLLHAADDLRICQVRCGARSYVVAEKSIPYDTVVSVIRRDIAAEKLPETWESWTGDAIVSLAVAMDGDPLRPRLYNFLPMDQSVQAPFPGYLDAPFLATLDRLNVQRGVELNDFLWEEARTLAVDAALAMRDCLPRHVARSAVLDLVLWSGEKDRFRERLLKIGAELIPTLSPSGRPGHWSNITQARLWRGDAFLNPAFIARHTSFPVVDDDVGPERVKNLQSFVAGTGLLVCSAAVRADVVEDVAKGLAARRSTIDHWNAFYLSLAELFRSDAGALAGKRLLLDGRGELKDTEVLETEQRGRRRRLRAMFLPALRSTGKDMRKIPLPKAVQQRLSFVHEGLELARHQASPARRFLLAANLVREHESREILRLLAGAINDPGETRDPEALRWEALVAMMQIVTDEDTAAGVVAEINPLVPTRDGWSRASTAYFCRWPETNGTEIERLLDDAAGVSSELDQHRSRLLRPYPEWPVTAGERSIWREFLRKAGVSDVLRVVPAIAGQMPRGWPGALQTALAQRSNLPAGQTARWKALLPDPAGVTNPQTDYTVESVYRLPGQLDFDALAPVVGPAYAEGVVRLLALMPESVGTTVFRPGHSHQPNTRVWPSPIAAFLRSAPWVPLADGQRTELARAWLPGEGRTPPPLLPLMSLELRRVLNANPNASEILRKMGLSEFGTNAAAWRYLAAAGALVDEKTSSGDAERLFNAAQEAWLVASLEAEPPPSLHLLGRRAGRVVAVDPRVDGSKVLIADGDDRQILAATAKANASTVLIEPPPARAKAVANYLAQHFPAVQRASQIEARYESQGQTVVASSQDPMLEDAFGDGVRQVLALTLRYRASFYRGNAEETLAHLSTVRTRALASLDLRVGDLSEPVPRFHQRALLLNGAEGPTILYSETMAASQQVLVGLAPAIAAAVGAPNIVGEPLLAFAAELGATGLSATFEDYAAILGVPVEEIKNVLGATRASIANLLRTIRPFVGYFADAAVAERFVVGAGMVHEEDVARLLERIGVSLPEPPRDIVRRCRDANDIAAIAISLRLDLQHLNDVIAALGPPYATIDLTERHRATLATFLSRKEGAIRESIRASHQSTFDAGESLAAYVAARDALRPELPAGYGVAHAELLHTEMQAWLDRWMEDHGAGWHSEPTVSRQQRDAVREANLKLVRSMIPDLRVAVLGRLAAEHPLRERYIKLAEVEAAAVNAALSGGWADFNRLDRDEAMTWLLRAGMVPNDWSSFENLAITDEERVACQGR
ncbi:ATP-binding protein [Mesorhizobium sp. CO1-1-8]|uniref:ATP-binding protein n=1 Tax=Mesorhizobium sp. CO1-1-8 TaxID=2876631 RepID=UPI001CD09A26|nr:ATP-binding protein [Mesorhizobium sp. CO1-1-8]MBZ9775047.1 ATP-binding protein [Mesorhizobium sp. CO1-1-8]